MQPGPLLSPTYPQKTWTPNWCSCMTPRKRLRTSKGNCDRPTTTSNSYSSKVMSSNRGCNTLKTKSGGYSNTAKGKSKQWSRRWWNTNSRWMINTEIRHSGLRAKWVRSAKTRALPSSRISLGGIKGSLSSRLREEDLLIFSPRLWSVITDNLKAHYEDHSLQAKHSLVELQETLAEVLWRTFTSSKTKTKWMPLLSVSFTQSML